MKEVKQPKKPLIFYYLIVLIIIMVLNFIFVPWFAERSIEEVDYGTFISMTDDKKIDEVDIEAQSNVIYFTGKDDKKVYKTAMVSDENLTERLYKSGAKFSGQEIKQTSPILSFYTQLDRAYTYIHITWKNACQSDDEARRRRQEFHDVWNGQE